MKTSSVLIPIAALILYTNGGLAVELPNTGFDPARLGLKPATEWRPMALPPPDINVDVLTPAELRHYGLPRDLNANGLASPRQARMRDHLRQMLRGRGLRHTQEPLGKTDRIKFGDWYVYQAWAGPIAFNDGRGVGSADLSAIVPQAYGCPGGVNRFNDCTWAIWGGFGGWADYPLGQAGHAGSVNGRSLGGDGSGPVILTWIECVPDFPMFLAETYTWDTIDTAVWPTGDGHQMTAYVVDEWMGTEFFGTLPCEGANNNQATVEAILEAPNLGGFNDPLAGLYDPVAFSAGGSTFDLSNWDDPAINAVYMLRDNQVVAYPLLWGNYTVSWKTYQ